MNNSRQSKDQYDAWLGLSSEQIRVVYNGLLPSLVKQRDRTAITGIAEPARNTRTTRSWLAP